MTQADFLWIPIVEGLGPSGCERFIRADRHRSTACRGNASDAVTLANFQQ